ncbi:alpha/beta hydrolase [Gorillibacterium sp. sgz5001074]|uniref:alpha/beta hydrolase n=1 Tax=Gorillibacterium sp. sgz5001074 TaxID=3446695 RepID=UPI003F673F84
MKGFTKEIRDIRSVEGNRAYRLFIAAPEGEPPPGGYPVLYVLDANAVFDTVVETLAIQSRRSDKTGVDPAVVVGIGYQTDALFSQNRFYDFTLPRPEGEAPYAFRGKTFAECGGAEIFHRFIEREVKAAVERDYPVNRERQGIVGHSLGGLFVLQVLLTAPGSYQSYVAGSPSIHWNSDFVFGKLEEFPRRLEECAREARLLIAVGSEETSHGMIENARIFADRMAVLAGKELSVQYTLFPDEGHVSLLPALMSRTVRLAARARKGLEV